jgi:hypothetical protein
MKKWDELKKSALESCNFRGHKMGIFGFTLKQRGMIGGSTCKKCGKMVFLNTNPLPNEIEISGEAVALHCKD